MFDLITMGEILVDFTPCGISANGSPRFEANAGGAPANVAVGAAKFGAKTAFVGKLGMDGLSLMLRETLIQNNVDVHGLAMDCNCDPALAFVQLDSNGDRCFSFFRRKAADTNMHAEEYPTAMFTNGMAFHFGSLSLTDEPSRSTVLTAAETAKNAGLLISFDPNYRAPLWKSCDEFLIYMRQALPLCHILKISLEEMQLLTGQSNVLTGMKDLADTYDIPLIFVTLGADGCQWLFRGKAGSAPAFDVPTIDTTGAGDSFLAATLYQILCGAKRWKQLNAQDIDIVARFACAASSLTTMKTGAIQAIPTLDQVKELLSTGKILQRR